MGRHMTLTVLSKPGCMGCVMLKNLLDNEGVSYNPVDITEVPEAIDKYGISALPVTVLEDSDGNELERVLKFAPEEIKKLVAKLPQAQAV